MSCQLAQYAACGAAIDLFQYINQGANLETRGKYGNTPLIVASLRSDLPMVVLLLDCGALAESSSVDENIVSAWGGITALLAATMKNLARIAQTLSQRGSNVNERLFQKATTLHIAASNGYFGLAQLLLDHGSDPGRRNDDALTAWDLAANPEIREILQKIC